LTTSYDTHRRLSEPSAAPVGSAAGEPLHRAADIATLAHDAPGFHGESPDWTPELAERLAAYAGIAQLTDRHWQVIALCREEAVRLGAAPDRETLARLSGLGDAMLASLFPDDPAALVATISGVSSADPR
jgi:sulfur relay (sulfurtransferase) DsrC/TusE family protein